MNIDFHQVTVKTNIDDFETIQIKVLLKIYLSIQVEERYWNYVMARQNHICVHSGSIDSGSWGYGFAVAKNSPFARHPWNLKVLTNNSGSFLKSLGPVMGK